MILNVATNPDSILKFENKVLNYLGNLSYGIYMFHMIAIFICIKIFYLPGGYFSSNNFVLYTTSCLFTILISHLSYLYFERYFLRVKSKFNKSIVRK
jgi:peptidoglycan/LPS O-acetylase OafA/YrhL